MCQETTKKKEEDGALTLRGRAAYENLQIGTLGGHVPTMTIAFHPRGVEPACPPLGYEWGVPNPGVVFSCPMTRYKRWGLVTRVCRKSPSHM